MSSYSCVIPVDWALLWEDVIPAWLSLLAGSITPHEFYARYVPAGEEYGELLLDEGYAESANFLSLFPVPLRPPFSRDKLHEISECLRIPHDINSVSCLAMLAAAIKQSAAINPVPDDPYVGDYFAFTEDRSGKKLAAGTKNLYSFLETAFEVCYNSETHLYHYFRRTEGTSNQLHTLFESLFLYQRVIPGTWFPSDSPIWPGFDDESFAGYLSPREVALLWNELVHWESRTLVEDCLYPLFADRVKRAAEAGYGLLTIHAGL